MRRQEEVEEEDGGLAPASLSRATQLIAQALKEEKAGAYPVALQGQGDYSKPALGGPSTVSPACREGVKKEAAEHLKWADAIRAPARGPAPHLGGRGPFPRTLAPALPTTPFSSPSCLLLSPGLVAPGTISTWN